MTKPTLSWPQSKTAAEAIAFDNGKVSILIVELEKLETSEITNVSAADIQAAIARLSHSNGGMRININLI